MHATRHSLQAAISHDRRSRATRLGMPRLAVVLLATAGMLLMSLARVRLATAQTPVLGASATTLLPQGITAKSPPTDSGQAITSAQCAKCHIPEKVLSHPVGVQPSMAVPAALPLDQGAVNCTTCHQDNFAAHALATADRPMLRVDATGMAFCNQCHAGGDLSSHGQHPHAMAQAHLGWISNPVAGLALAPPRRSSAVVDGVNTCLSCHDGTIASDKFGGLSDGGVTAKQSGSHSVGVDYQAAWVRGENAKLQPLGAVDHRVLLANGQVTCLSCHSLYSRGAGLLVIPNDNSALCSTCHRE